MLRRIRRELKRHAPFTALGAVAGIGTMLVLRWIPLATDTSETLFEVLHPLHVFLSALVTASMFRLRRGRGLVATLLVGYLGSVGIATLSDCLIPYVGEVLLELPRPHLHLGMIEMWWLVNPLALGGIVLAGHWPHTKLPHAGHVLLSTWASLFHVMMALGSELGAGAVLLIGVFLFLAVWIPCCASDIIFPLIFTKD